MGPRRSNTPVFKIHEYHYAPWLPGWKIPSGYRDPDMIVKLFQPCLNYTKRKAVIFHRYFHRVEGLEWKRLSWSTFMFTIVISQGSVENRIHSSEEKWMKEWIAGSGNRQVIRHWEISNSRKLIPPPSLKGSGEKTGVSRIRETLSREEDSRQELWWGRGSVQSREEEGNPTSNSPD